MSNQNQNVQEQWSRLVEQMNDAVARSVEQNMEAQAAFMDSWADAMEQSIPEEEEIAEGLQGYSQAYEVWMDAAEQIFDRTTAAAHGEEVSIAEVRDIWLQSANEAFKEVMNTSAFAAANGQLVNAMMQMREQAEDVSEDTLAQLGLPTQSDVDEIGERLVELERRQHGVKGEVESAAAEFRRGQETVEERLDEVAAQTGRIESVDDRLGGLDDRLGGLDDRLDGLEDIEAQLDDVEDQLDDLEDQLDRLEDIEERLGDLEDLEDRLDELDQGGE